jgi:hypothetical protein
MHPGLPACRPYTSAICCLQVRPIDVSDFVAAVGAIKPSVSRDQLHKFEAWTRDYGLV